MILQTYFLWISCYELLKYNSCSHKRHGGWAPIRAGTSREICMRLWGISRGVEHHLNRIRAPVVSIPQLSAPMLHQLALLTHIVTFYVIYQIKTNALKQNLWLSNFVVVKDKLLFASIVLSLTYNVKFLIEQRSMVIGSGRSRTPVNKVPIVIQQLTIKLTVLPVKAV